MIKKITFVGLFAFSLCVNLNGQTKSRIAETITDNAIEVPAEIERNFDQLLIDWKKNMRLSPACDRIQEGNIVYEDSVYINRLYSYPSQMELTYNQIVRSYIDMYTNRQRNSVGYILAKSKYYNPIFESALDKYGLPIELKYLPVIESAINPIAVSRAGATGIWQFMIGTGKMYDLEINSLVDERRDPIKSTDAAARYFRDLYDIYGDWNLVIAAYNCGPGNVNKAIRRSGGQTDYWAIYPFLPKETRGYVPAFIAATYVMNYHEKHNICAMECTLPMSMDTLMIDQTVHFKQISDVLNIPIEDIRTLNPQYKRDMIPGEYKTYSLCLPSQKIMDFISQRDSIMNHQSEELLTHRKVVEPNGTSTASASSGERATYRVKKGDNLGAIARKHGVSIDQIKRWNNLKSAKLAVGKRLVVGNPVVSAKPIKKEELAVNKKPEEKKTTTDTVSTEKASEVLVESLQKEKEKEQAENAEDTSIERRSPQPDTRTIYHKVRIGETMTQIANRYNVTRKEIMSWNKLSSNVAKVGQRLLIHIPPKKEAEVKVEEVAEKKLESEVKAKPKAEPAKPKAKVEAKSSVHVVKSGDTLSGIASRHKGVTVNDIRKANKLANDKLSLGQKLIIPKK